jgi:hypothetical protein
MSIDDNTTKIKLNLNNEFINIKKKDISNNDINYQNYYNEKIILKKYKIPDLKHAAKKYKLHISGSKKLLINRLETYFNNCHYAIKIQKWFRKSIVMKSILLRGIGIIDRKKCVNDTDFISMEPINEIEFEYFFSYTDNKNFTYGFNIISLIQLLKRKESIENPYNREKFSNKVISDIITIYKSNFIIFPQFKKENENYLSTNSYKRQNMVISTPNIQTIRERNTLRQLHRYNNTPNQNQQPETESIINEIYNPTIYNQNISFDDITRFNNIQNIRNNTVEQRINQLFIEIDHLGNYTQSSWFSELDFRGYNRLYRTLFDIWTHRSQMDRDTKISICPFHGPFDNIWRRSVQNNEITLEQMKLACLIVFENMIYSGINEDYRKIGCFHVLSALTIVSLEARNAMMWLYESIVY